MYEKLPYLLKLNGVSCEWLDGGLQNSTHIGHTVGLGEHLTEPHPNFAFHFSVPNLSRTEQDPGQQFYISTGAC